MSGESEPWTPTEQSAYTYELARSITLLRDSHYRHCTHGDWSERCPVFAAWDQRRPRPEQPMGYTVPPALPPADPALMGTSSVPG